MRGEIRKRQDIDERYRWDLESVYADEADWERDFERAETEARAFKDAFEGRIGRDAETLLSALEKKDAVWRLTERVCVYARMRRDEDNRNARYQALCDRTSGLTAKAAAAFAFFTPELAEIPDARIEEFLVSAPGLAQYAYYLKTVAREKPHVLSSPEEAILAQLSEVTGATGDIFGMINNADMRFGTIRDENGEETELTHGRYIAFMESRDRTVRRTAFEQMHAAYAKQRNTLAATYACNTKFDVAIARIRRYPSALEAALAHDNIPLAVYDNLIDSVNGRLGVLHRYLDIRKKVMGLDALHLYDVYAPLFEDADSARPIPFEEGMETVLRGLSVLGDAYADTVRQSVRERWMDVFENDGKTSGAYSFGSYDSKPFILLNYTEKLKDVFTLAHEMGHSMHAWYTRRAQPFIYGGHSIFTAEVASTVNEALLMRRLIDEAKDAERKKYLLSLHIEEFRTTLFRQTMFAEFEKRTHADAEAGRALTADYLSEIYYALNEKYFGTGVTLDEAIATEWARIPHFYRAFYVYKYATGYSAATAVAGLIASEGRPAADAYIAFLKTGESDDPIELLRTAGVDMSERAPVEAAMDHFEALVGELAALI